MTDFYSGELLWFHYAIPIVILLLLGFCCGYFIWRKESMQAVDAEIEVRRTEDELRHLREDLSREEKMIRSEDEGSELEALVTEATDQSEASNSGAS